ncbi:hypothetical protein ABZX85_39500 [Streptomyces sp. NPDC004539]|uniref:hypothetical protein n=1 Tax=Streptomyces sp. NPDC004539 TaxID=3154280 RepID=UPI0033B90F79
MTSTPNAFTRDLATVAGMLRLLGRVTVAPPGPGQLAPDPSAISQRMAQALAFERECADNARHLRKLSTDSAADPPLAVAYAAAAVRAATITRHLGVAFDLSVKCALTARGAPRSAAESLHQRRRKAAGQALTEAEKEADRGHQEVLGFVTRIASDTAGPPAAQPLAEPAPRERR